MTFSVSRNLLLAVLVCTQGCRESADSRASKPATSSSVAPARPSSSGPVQSPARIDPPTGPGSEAPNLFVSPAGALLTWIEPIETKPTIRWARFSQGRWTEATTVVTSEDLLINWSDVPAAAEVGGRMFVAFPEMRRGGEGYRAALSVSMDEGRTFVRRGALHSDTSDGEHGFVAFAPENADTVRAFWLDGRATAGPNPAMRLYTTVIGDSTAPDVVLDERTCDCCSLGVARAASGSVVAYRDRQDDEVRDISVIHAESQGFSRPNALHADGYRIAGCPVNGPAVAADGARVAIAWYTYAQEQPRVKVAFSSDNAQHFAPPLNIADTTPSFAPLGRVSAAWGDQGDALVGYVESDREKARIVIRRVHPDGKVFAPFVVADTRPERKSGFPKMVRLDDRVMVVWTEATSPSRVRAALVPLSAISRETQAPAAASEAPQVREGDKAPVFEAQTLEGKSISTTTLAGKPVLLNLWASYCEPCRQEQPILSALHKKYEQRGLQVVGIAMDESLTGEALKKIAQRRSIKHSLWLDPADHAGRAFGIRVLPATILINGKGTIVAIRRGALHEKDVELERAIESAL